MPGGHHPWYVFRGHPIPSVSDSESNTDSFVPLHLVRTPPHMQQGFEQVASDDSSMKGREGVDARKLFVNAQWAFGGAGTGAPVSGLTNR